MIKLRHRTILLWVSAGGKGRGKGRNRRSTQLEGQGTPRDKGRHSGFPSHVLESENAVHSVGFLSPEQKRRRTLPRDGGGHHFGPPLSQCPPAVCAGGTAVPYAGTARGRGGGHLEESGYICGALGAFPGSLFLGSQARHSAPKRCAQGAPRTAQGPQQAHTEGSKG